MKQQTSQYPNICSKIESLSKACNHFINSSGHTSIKYNILQLDPNLQWIPIATTFIEGYCRCIEEYCRCIETIVVICRRYNTLL